MKIDRNLFSENTLLKLSFRIAEKTIYETKRGKLRFMMLKSNMKKVTEGFYQFLQSWLKLFQK